MEKAKGLVIAQNVVLGGVALFSLFTLWKLYDVDRKLKDNSFSLALEMNNIIQLEMARGRTFLEAHKIAQDYMQEFQVNILDGNRLRTKYLF